MRTYFSIVKIVMLSVKIRMAVIKCGETRNGLQNGSTNFITTINPLKILNTQRTQVSWLASQRRK